MRIDMKIGILGGTFDPIHNTHIYMGNQVLKALDLDKLYFMPAFYPPHKNAEKITDETHRLNMIKLAIEDLENIDCLTLEIDSKLSYTADTLTVLKNKYPNDEFYFIIGGDSISSFESWYHPEIILEKASIVVIRRKDETLDTLDATISHIISKFQHTMSKHNTKVLLLDTDVSNISSSYIRTHPLEECRSMIPEKVYNYILKNQLYSDNNKNMAWSVGKIKSDLKKLLNPHRYQHTLGVADTAKRMAEAFHINPNLAYLAGLLHDCAKHYSNDELIRFCKKNNIFISKSEQNAPFLLHGKVGAYIAREKYHVENSDVLNAVRWHTTGKADMTTLEQIIFCADYIEPSRTIQPNLSYLRKISDKNLDLLTCHIIHDTLNYLKTKEQIIDEHTEEAYRFYKEKVGDK